MDGVKSSQLYIYIKRKRQHQRKSRRENSTPKKNDEGNERNHRAIGAHIITYATYIII